ncbi:MAG: substrate-binding domain-containing protein [Thiobacillus sp.]|nr:substrate-binding domain-containing protein [Thiobacillus sp.]
MMAATFLLLLTAFGTHQAAAQTSAGLRVYGPGGPAPAMKEAAKAFEQKTGTPVVVTAGPTPEWIEQATRDADLIYSGSETMMTDFAQAMESQIDEARVEPLYLRPFSILVRPGNPKNIKGLRDLFRPGYRVMVVNGAGQNGVWEDAAGRQGDIKSVRALRKNIVKYAKNSALAKQAWVEDPSLDAWLIWNIWQVANPTLADVVPVEKDYVIYRDTGIVVTKKGDSSPAARQFMDFLKSPDGAAIFQKWGWMTSANKGASKK